MRTIMVLAASPVFGLACSGSSDVISPATTGGTTALGGAPSLGGNVTSGGISSGIGGTATSAASGSGNVAGALDNGGTSCGGKSTTGGASSSGGSTASGGNSATGGASSSGGANAAGGKSATAGSNATGGQTATGGATSSSGSNAAGVGGKAVGGTTSRGGTTSGGLGHRRLNQQFKLARPNPRSPVRCLRRHRNCRCTRVDSRSQARDHPQFFGWSDDWVARVPGDLSSGRIPLITWKTWNAGVGVPLDDILGGAHDSMIRTRATAAKNVGQRFFLRWGHEMNGNWYPWDGSHNGANAAAAAKYIAVYKHIHDLFLAQGATNVLWVFCPNVGSVPGDAWNQWSNYYPGDAYVDWMAFDGYNWGISQSGAAWQSFANMIALIYPSLAAKNKPIMIPETASTELGGDKAAWIAGVVPALKSSYPAIKAFVWFHMNKETDWRLDSSTATRAAATTMVNDAYFNP